MGSASQKMLATLFSCAMKAPQNFDRITVAPSRQVRRRFGRSVPLDPPLRGSPRGRPSGGYPNQPAATSTPDTQPPTSKHSRRPIVQFSNLQFPSPKASVRAVACELEVGHWVLGRLEVGH